MCADSKPLLVIFTNNAHKLSEIREILADFAGEVRGYLDVFPEEVDVIEDGDTFEANSLKKVWALPDRPNTIYLADDSGLEVEALDNRPGVYSARYGGDVSSEERCRLLLKEMEGVENRKARFRTVIALRFSDGAIRLFEGVVEGRLTHDLHGDKGFGYDPLFVPNGYAQTFGEMSSMEKHALSHRGRALAEVALVLKEEKR